MPNPVIPTNVAIAIPAYQAAASIGDVVKRARMVCQEVVVIDDGSRDGTAAAARAAGARVIVHERNQGKGAALRTAFGDLLPKGFDAVITLDADGQHLPEETPKLLDAWRQGADLVLGSREELFEQMAPVRRFSNRTSSRLISFAAGRRMNDVQTGFRLYTRKLVEATGFPESRFEAESAVVVRASRRGFKVVLVPVKLGFADGRTTSHYRAVLDSLRIARAVLRSRFESL